MAFVKPKQIISIVEHPDGDNAREMALLLRMALKHGQSSIPNPPRLMARCAKGPMQAVEMLYEPSKTVKSLLFELLGPTHIMPAQGSSARPQLVDQVHEKAMVEPKRQKRECLGDQMTSTRGSTGACGEYATEQTCVGSEASPRRAQALPQPTISTIGVPKGPVRGANEFGNMEDQAHKMRPSAPRSSYIPPSPNKMASDPIEEALVDHFRKQFASGAILPLECIQNAPFQPRKRSA